MIIANHDFTRDTKVPLGRSSTGPLELDLGKREAPLCKRAADMGEFPQLNSAPEFMQFEDGSFGRDVPTDRLRELSGRLLS